MIASKEMDVGSEGALVKPSIGFRGARIHDDDMQNSDIQPSQYATMPALNDQPGTPVSTYLGIGK